MKKIAAVTLCMLTFTCSFASGSPRTGTMPEGICTRDFNLWGHASQCSCGDLEIYDDRAGLCLHGEHAETISVQGQVATGIVAIGGETTGVIITTADDISYELILTVTDQQKLSNLNGKRFAVTGELITIESTEISDRKAIIADSLAAIE